MTLKNYRLIALLLIAILMTGCNNNISIESLESSFTEIDFTGYTLIEVDGGELSGHREANVVVDIGFGDREYWAFTNEYGQLVKVVANEIILQDEDNEAVLSTGRYYYDEAKVPGVESKTLDEGHIIADSLGGVANAYNITPQNSTLNRHGDQAYLEQVIRAAKGCINFEALITYPNTETQIPSVYSFTYTINGHVIKDEFQNINSELSTNSDSPPREVDSKISISRIDRNKEEIDITNTGSETINLNGYKIVSVKGHQSFSFTSYELKHSETVTVYAKGGSGHLKWSDQNIWNNSADPAELYDAQNNLIDHVD